jgi:predicted PurR-regulated permease PerM
MQLQSGGIRSLTIACWLMAGLAVVAALYFARTLFIPVTLACVIGLVLAPIVRALCRIGLPRALASGLVVIASILVVAAILARLSSPAVEWFSRVPLAMARLRYTFREFVIALQDVREFTQSMARLSPGESEGSEVVVQGPDLAQVFLTNTGELLAMIVVTGILLFFLLANGYLFLQKTVHVLPRFGDKKRAVEIGRALQIEVSRYLFTITAINVALGCATSAAMFMLGLPDPLLWGVLATLLNFIPYAGPILTLGAILLASVVTFSTPLDVFLPPLAFGLLQAIEGNVITPMLLGRSLTLNPVIVFVSLLLWGWLWGPAGMLLAVPLLVIAKILCDHIEPLAVVGEYLSSLPPESAAATASRQAAESDD